MNRYYRYRVQPLLPEWTKIAKRYEDVVNYAEPKLSKDIWEWFEKDWIQWLDELSCRWIKYRKIVTIAKKELPVQKTFDYKEYTLDMRNLVKSILEYANQYHCMTGRKIECILVGQDIYRELRHQTQLMSFAFPTEFVTGNIETFCGCQIVLVPNMEGIAFLPEIPKPERF